MEIIDISGADLAFLKAVIDTAYDQDQSVRMAVRANGLIVSRAGSMWCAPIGNEG